MKPKIVLASPVSLAKNPKIISRWLEWMEGVVEKSGMVPYLLIDNGDDERLESFANRFGGKTAPASGTFPWDSDNEHHSRRVAWVREQLRQVLLEQEWDYALWVDCDTFIPEKAAEMLYKAIQEQRTPVASGLVPDRWNDHIVICMNEDYLAMPSGIARDKAPALAQWTGFGCLMMKRAMLEKQGWAEYGQVEVHGYPRRGEDTWWCRKVGTGVALALDAVCQHADDSLKVRFCEWVSDRLVVATRNALPGEDTVGCPAVQYIGGGKCRHPILGKFELGEIRKLTPEHGVKFRCEDLNELQRRLCFYDQDRPNGQFLPVVLQEPVRELDR